MSIDIFYPIKCFYYYSYFIYTKYFGTYEQKVALEQIYNEVDYKWEYEKDSHYYESN
jgi:hypothetical protein